MTNLITSSFGKKYNNEKACISLTSWKARINTVGLTIYNLLTVCPGFHIVLTLAEEEFPKKEAELPVDIVKMAAIGLYEILWVKKNYKAFKKVIFTMDKNRTVPVISADDDCVYQCNYAEELYQSYINNIHKKCIIRYNPYSRNGIRRNIGTQGPCTLYSPENHIHFYKYTISALTDNDISASLDDNFADTIITKYNIELYDLDNANRPYMFHTSNGALHPEQKTLSSWKKHFL